MVSLFAIPAFAAEEAAEEGNGINTGLIIGLIVGAVVLAIVVILCIKFREKLGKFFRVYKSEAKKIVWLPWNQTKKSTLVVLVVLIIFAVAICLIDLALSRSFLKFVELFSK
ncbi:MAG: preprotein translocase subunit SecE [Clostridia bacterium]|nr:preprotein translocase subunit SecE [Clostridia bacterium]